MKKKNVVTVEVFASRELRLAINARYGRKGPATDAQVQACCENLLRADLDVIIDDHRDEKS